MKGRFEYFSISGVNALPRFADENINPDIIQELRPLGSSISLYIHIPFCKSICHFCMLRKGAKAVESIPDSFISTVLNDLSLHIDTFKDITISSVYFGGGTPSMLHPSQFTKIISSIACNFKLDPKLEISFEGEATSLNNPSLLLCLKQNSVRRISYGVQTFDPALRELLGRTDTIKDLFNLRNSLDKYGFDEVNIDYIYSLPNTDRRFIEKELQILNKYCPTSIDCHPLKYISCSSFMLDAIKANRMEIPNAELRINLFNDIRSWCLNNNYQEQFVDQYSTRKLKNTNKYMRHLYGLDGGEYIGIGPGARSHYGNYGFTKYQNFHEYSRALQENIYPIHRIAYAPHSDNYITCFPKRNDLLTLNDIMSSQQSSYFIKILSQLTNDGYLKFSDDGYQLTALGLSWYQNLQELLLSERQRKNHSLNIKKRSQKFEKYNNYFDKIGGELC